jgi:hypothetical protein
VLLYRHGKKHTIHNIFVHVPGTSVGSQRNCLPNYVFTDAGGAMNIPVTNGDGLTAWASDRAPSDCAAQALLGFFEEKFDLLDLTACNDIQGLESGS